MKSENLARRAVLASEPDPRARYFDEWAEVQALCESLAEAGGNLGAEYRALPPIIPNTRL